MLSAIARRVLLAIPTVFGVSVIVFAIIRLVPGDPVLVILGMNATPAEVAQTRHALGLDQPVYIQYARWAAAALHGNFGYDYQSGEPISSLLAQALPVTAELVVMALGLAVVLGILAGVAAACWRNRTPDWIVQAACMLGTSVPDFWLGVILMLLFGLHFALFPTSGFIPLSQGVAANVSHMVLPALALCASLTAVLARMTRAAMLEVLNQEYIRFARASGVPATRVVFSHALRNSVAPVVTVIGIQAGYLFGATVIIEKVFSLPGVGQLILNSTLNHDYPVIQASVLLLAVLFIVTNLVVDTVHIWLDPKLRTGGA